ncbi:disintegrin and metalloproteinase domain-containing protein 10-like isoform X2 [Ptychodera flava]|uniref:disintegrin and metalloproteinase domain-containing protein 10-like isoform X2 n=1 Tax=Ptychodera flava TaxID=63121 RepID=UPI003969F6A2
MAVLIIFLYCLCFTFGLSLCGPDRPAQIHPYIEYYEPLNYKRLESPRLGSDRQKRDGVSSFDMVLKLNFKAFKRNFNISLFRNTQLFADGAALSVVGKKNVVTSLIDTKTIEVYKGILEDQPASVVHGHLTNGIFDGVIKTKTEVYHMEPAERYLNETPDFHSVIYRAKDFKFNGTKTKEICGLTNSIQKSLHYEQMKTKPVTTDGNQDARENYLPFSEEYASNNNHSGMIFDGHDKIDVISFKGNTLHKIFHFQDKHKDDTSNHIGKLMHSDNTFSRQRRFAGKKNVMRTCPLYLVADHTFYKDVGGRSSSNALNEMAYHIQEADDVFRATDFNGDGIGDNIGFSIAGVTVFENSKSRYYKIGKTSDGVENVLNKFSEYNFNRYCIGVLFTHRDFKGGVLGLAWIGYSNLHGPAGGICQNRVRVRADNKDRNMNTAVITLKSFGIRLPTRMSSVTLMHELGHSFGAPHDPGYGKCSPGGGSGNYLMFPMAIDGSKPNNYIFSACSKTKVNLVVNSKGKHCLQEYDGPQCGNRIVEEGETCDCGTPAECPFTDSCCTPRGGRGNRPECTFKEGAKCSPKTSVCCSDACSVVQGTSKQLCKEGTDCASPTYCNGFSASCPGQVFHPDGAVCSNGKSRCFDGECTLSPCFDIGLEDCQCGYDDNSLCHLCCKVNNSCVSAESLGLVDVDGSIFYSATGHPCANNTGYCNSYGICISVDNENALNSLRKLISSKAMEGVEMWFRNNWYYIVAGVLTVGVVVLAIRVSCKKKSPRAVPSGDNDIYDEQNVEVTLEDINVRVPHSEHLPTVEELDERSEDDEHMDIETAVERLSSAFPTASKHVLLQAVKISDSEEEAFKALLLRGYTMKEIK